MRALDERHLYPRVGKVHVIPGAYDSNKTAEAGKNSIITTMWMPQDLIIFITIDVYRQLALPNIFLISIHAAIRCSNV
jgi:hypothetical protein